jgi:hypothetical protein
MMRTVHVGLVFLCFVSFWLVGCYAPESPPLSDPPATSCLARVRVGLRQALPPRIRVVADGRELFNDCDLVSLSSSPKQLGFYSRTGGQPVELRIYDAGTCNPSEPETIVLANLVETELVAGDEGEGCVRDYAGTAEGGVLLPPLTPVPPSEWGGGEAHLVVQTEGAELRLNCEDASLGPLLVDSQGRFTSRGTVRHRSGSVGVIVVEGRFAEDDAVLEKIETASGTVPWASQPVWSRYMPDPPGFELKRSAPPRFSCPGPIGGGE